MSKARAKYWERMKRSVNLANARDPDKRRAERHRLYVVTRHKKYLTNKKPLKMKDIRRAYKIAKRNIRKEARAEHRRDPRIHVKNYEAMLERVYFQEDEYPTHFRGDIRTEDLPK